MEERVLVKQALGAKLLVSALGIRVEGLTEGRLGAAVPPK
jgi:hypothetical protein